MVGWILVEPYNTASGRSSEPCSSLVPSGAKEGRPAVLVSLLSFGKITLGRPGLWRLGLWVFWPLGCGLVAQLVRARA